MRLPDFEAWAVFAKVAETGSFARAAAELGLSNPTVSKAVTRLEARLGAALFHRTSRRLSLSEAGRTALERAARLLADGEALEVEAQAGAATPQGLVRVAAPMSFGIQHLGPVLPGFFAAYPEVSVEMHLSDDTVDLITRGYDLAVRIAAMPDSSLLARRLCGVRLLLVGSPAYFARHGRPAHPRDLTGHVGLGYVYGPFRDTWRFRHASQGEFSIAMRCPLMTNNADVIQPALLQGLGLALQPDFIVWRDVQAGRLESVLDAWMPNPIAVNLVTPPNPLRPARVRVLMDYLAEAFAGAPWSGCGSGAPRSNVGAGVGAGLSDAGGGDGDGDGGG